MDKNNENNEKEEQKIKIKGRIKKDSIITFEDRDGKYIVLDKTKDNIFLKKVIDKNKKILVISRKNYERKS